MSEIDNNDEFLEAVKERHRENYRKNYKNKIQKIIDKRADIESEDDIDRALEEEKANQEFRSTLKTTSEARRVLNEGRLWLKSLGVFGGRR